MLTKQYSLAAGILSLSDIVFFGSQELDSHDDFSKTMSFNLFWSLKLSEFLGRYLSQCKLISFWERLRVRYSQTVSSTRKLWASIRYGSSLVWKMSMTDYISRNFIQLNHENNSNDSKVFPTRSKTVVPNMTPAAAVVVQTNRIPH